MLAYSTISHMGFMLLGCPGGRPPHGYSAAMFYAITYVLTTPGTFGMILLLSREGFEADQIDDFKGLNQRIPGGRVMMLLLMFSLAGVPPTVGLLRQALGAPGAVSAGFVWLAVVAVLFSVVGAFYYLRVVKVMYFDDAADNAPLAAAATRERCFPPTGSRCWCSACCRSL